MSGSNLTLPTRSEAQARCDMALKVARSELLHLENTEDDNEAATIGWDALANIIFILSGAPDAPAETEGNRG